jgi:hypothetical protein
VEDVLHLGGPGDDVRLVELLAEGIGAGANQGDAERRRASEAARDRDLGIDLCRPIVGRRAERAESRVDGGAELRILERTVGGAAGAERRVEVEVDGGGDGRLAVDDRMLAEQDHLGRRRPARSTHNGLLASSAPFAAVR